MNDEKRADHDVVSFAEFLDAVEPVLRSCDFFVSRKAKQIEASLDLTEGASMALLFKAGRYGVGNGFLDYHDRRQVGWLARILDKKPKDTSIWVYVQRLGVRVWSEKWKRLREEDVYYSAHERATLPVFIDHLSRDLSGRIIPMLQAVSLEVVLDQDHWLRNGALTFSGLPVGGGELQSWRGAEYRNPDPEIERRLFLQAQNQYWRRGGFLDLSALLALKRFDQAKALIERMPMEIDVSQVYYSSLDKVKDDEWRRARKIVEEIKAEMRPL